jgi:hypothetical protein
MAQKEFKEFKDIMVIILTPKSKSRSKIDSLQEGDNMSTMIEYK